MALTVALNGWGKKEEGDRRGGRMAAVRANEAGSGGGGHGGASA